MVRYMNRGFKVFFLLFPLYIFSSEISLGIDAFLEKETIKKYKNKRIGVITNCTALSKNGDLTIDRLLAEKDLCVKKIFSPEHGFYAIVKDHEKSQNDLYKNSIPIISLYGGQRRPTKQSLKDIEVLVFDIQDIGVRSYTYISTLFYCMEEAAKYGIEVCILDRPNPLGGINFDGPMMESRYRSFIGYINIPYCHGMTVCELALLFNREYKVNCNLTLFLMEGWDKKKNFAATKLLWTPQSPQMPESDTPFFYATTGPIGELSICSIGIGTTYPFKVIGAPWMDGEKLAKKLNNQKLPGVRFTPIRFKPNYGNSRLKVCKGVKIHITDHATYKPCKTGNMILGLLKSIYPKIVIKKLSQTSSLGTKNFNKAQGSDIYLSILSSENFPAYKLIHESEKDHAKFKKIKRKYTLYQN